MLFALYLVLVAKIRYVENARASEAFMFIFINEENKRVNYWLVKTEPTAFNITDLAAAKNKTTHWDGVRNYQARNMMRDDMKKGDLAFFYHSSCKTPGIVGVVEVCKTAYPDHTAFDPEDPHYDPKSDPNNPRWFMVDIKLKRQLKSAITLQQLREQAALQDMQLLRKGNRLSVMPVSKFHWDVILGLI